jgi:hypothetical protein
VVNYRSRTGKRDLTKGLMKAMEDGSDIVVAESGNEEGLDSSDVVEGVVRDCQRGRIWGRWGDV